MQIFFGLLDWDFPRYGCNQSLVDDAISGIVMQMQPAPDLYLRSNLPHFRYRWTVSPGPGLHPRTVIQTRVTNPLDTFMTLQMFGHSKCVFTNFIHSQGQGFEALQGQE